MLLVAESHVDASNVSAKDKNKICRSSLKH